ncbi:MAG: ABC transporter permease [Deltaproteobacteria bacterium]|nr:ABC transporter permease [bacterium]MCB9475887.1 ABC transporter permease [Deltaproteobacteria bacterium]MCB9488549.1 ABC transporter permease [Deltaproteobacteria bacterium]
MTTKVFETIGAAVIGALEEVGRYLMLVYETLLWLVKPPYRIELLIKQVDFIGVSSLSIILLTGGFTGAVMALQTSHAFRSFDANVMVGPAVALAITRELGPVLSALMIAGRCGSSMAAEIGTMKVTEQIDALHTMAVSPVQYLVVPRVVACTLMIPALTVIFDFIGVFGAWVVSTFLLDVPSKHFYDSVLSYVKLSDFTNGLVKATAFGFIIAVVSCFKGMGTTRGAAGVGKATTESVVVSSVTVLISDYFLTAMLF